MNEAISIYTPGVIVAIEQFAYAVEELRQFVIYTYYDKAEEPLYIGCSKDFYNAHYFNSQQLNYFDEIEYVGFIFLRSEENMKETKKYYIRAREPKHNRGKYIDLPYIKGCDVYSDDFVVNMHEMETWWRATLGLDGEDEEALTIEALDAEAPATALEE